VRRCSASAVPAFRGDSASSDENGRKDADHDFHRWIIGSGQIEVKLCA